MTIAASKRPARWLAVFGLASGLLTMVMGLGLALIGIGFVNATASGTGMAGFGVGLWTVLACRGLWRRRPITFVGLTLAWLWLLGRVGFDWLATAVSAVVVLFLLPMVSVPLGGIWALASTVFLGLLGASGVRSIRQQKREPAAAAPAHAGFTTTRNLVGLAMRLTCVAVVTLGAPQLVWLDREHKLAQLAADYAPTNHTTSPAVTWGACSSVFLGYELTQHGAERAKDATAREAIYGRVLADAQANLDSIVMAGARLVRAGASGDHLIESKPDQERIDDRYVAAVRRTGKELVLVDTQHPKALRNHRLDWAAFCKFQRERIEYYQRRYEPEVYFVVCEPMSYHGFAFTPETEYSAEAWATQLSEMCRLVKSVRPATRTGICLLVMPDKEPEWEVWSRMKTLPELDILSVEIYAPENFRQTEERLARYGHPREVGKAFWIAETYNGWALCGDRRWDLDAAWFKVSDNFAQRVGAETVLAWTFGTFVPEGSFWDFGSGRLAARWNATKRISLVGDAFWQVSRQAARGEDSARAAPRYSCVPTSTPGRSSL